MKLIALIAVLTFSGGQESVRTTETLPFVGRWAEAPESCGSPFVFTPNSYSPSGSKRLLIRSIERSDRDFLLSFDEYRVSLFDITDQTMTWHSPISGDTFDLMRCS
jgi:hypothetical protein